MSKAPVTFPLAGSYIPLATLRRRIRPTDPNAKGKRYPYDWQQEVSAPPAPGAWSQGVTRGRALQLWRSRMEWSVKAAAAALGCSRAAFGRWERGNAETPPYVLLAAVALELGYRLGKPAEKPQEVFEELAGSQKAGRLIKEALGAEAAGSPADPTGSRDFTVPF